MLNMKHEMSNENFIQKRFHYFGLNILLRDDFNFLKFMK